VNNNEEVLNPIEIEKMRLKIEKHYKKARKTNLIT
jgi:hypothetical protein